MADMEQSETESTHDPIVASHDDTTPRKRNARRIFGNQDEHPHHAPIRAMPARVEQAFRHVLRCAEICDDNRAKEITLLDMRESTPLIDFFLICTASTRRLGNAIAIEIDSEMKKLKDTKLGMEGTEEGSWILIDYGDFVVHLFTPEARAYYSLDGIWGDAPRIDWKNPALPPPRLEADPLPENAEDL
jgi:ribosome-associated protein